MPRLVSKVVRNPRLFVGVVALTLGGVSCAEAPLFIGVDLAMLLGAWGACP